jgi:hypothetical protein
MQIFCDAPREENPHGRDCMLIFIRIDYCYAYAQNFAQNFARGPGSF